MMKAGFIQFQQQQEQPGLEENMSNLTSSASGDQASASSANRAHQNYYFINPPSQTTQPVKKKRNLPGNPDPEAEVIALSPRGLQATNRFVCEICNKGFQRDQNLQLHRRGHNLPWKLKKRTKDEVIRKKVYVCPEPSCVHHHPSRALGDLTGIKKHYSRKHGEKKWKCEKCSKRYAVRSDWKSHSKICGTKEYRCDSCGTLFSRRDSFITHRAFCDALTEESARDITANPAAVLLSTQAGSSLSSHVDMHHTKLINPLHHDQYNIHAFTLKKEQPTLKPADIPPWLACHQPVLLQAPTQQEQVSVIDLSNCNSSSFPAARIDHQDFHYQTNQDSADQNTNPNPTQSPAGIPFYQASSSPHMSATALLQKATQIGASMSNSSSQAAGPSSPSMNVSVRPHQQNQGPTADHVSAECPVNNNTTSFGLNLPSREEMSSGNSVQCLSPFGNKAAIPTPFTVHPAASVVSQPPNVNYLQDMITSLSNSTTGFEGTSFENAFGGMFSSKNGGNLQDRVSMAPTHLHNSTSSGSESLTKDFLGLTPLSHSDILSFAGLSRNLNTSSQGEHQNQSQHQKTWKP